MKTVPILLTLPFVAGCDGWLQPPPQSAQGSGIDAQLVGTWRLRQHGDADYDLLDVADDIINSVFFSEIGETTARNDCNGYGGMYEVGRGGMLDFRFVSGSEAGCNSGPFDLYAIADTHHYDLDGETLRIYSTDGFTQDERVYVFERFDGCLVDEDCDDGASCNLDDCLGGYCHHANSYFCPEGLGGWE